MSFASPIAADSGMIVDRAPSDVARAGLPAGFRAVSADNHIEVDPRHLRRRLPGSTCATPPRKSGSTATGGSAFPARCSRIPKASMSIGALVRANIVDGFDMAQRNRHLDVEGIAQEIVYPQSLLAFVRYPDHEVQEAIYRCWNQYMAECGRESPGRFFGVGICPNWWDPDRAEAAIAQIVDLGLKSFMLPYSPGLDNAGRADQLCRQGDGAVLGLRRTRPGCTVNFHIGEVPGQNMRGGFGTLFLTQAAPFRRVFGKLMFGGMSRSAIPGCKWSSPRAGSTGWRARCRTPS